MRIQGHSAAGGRHGSSRQQDRVRDAAKEQQGRHILSVDSDSEVQAQLRAVTAFDGSDQLSARHRVAY
jgi:hypothetical protein